VKTPRKNACAVTCAGRSGTRSGVVDVHGSDRPPATATRLPSGDQSTAQNRALLNRESADQRCVFTRTFMLARTIHSVHVGIRLLATDHDLVCFRMPRHGGELPCIWLTFSRNCPALASISLAAGRVQPTRAVWNRFRTPSRAPNSRAC